MNGLHPSRYTNAIAGLSRKREDSDDDIPEAFSRGGEGGHWRSAATGANATVPVPKRIKRE